MKQTSKFKSMVLSAALSAALLSVTSCSNSTKTEDPKEVAEDHNEAKYEKSKEDDAQFLVDAAEINLEEIKLGEMAQSKGTTAHIKEMGKMMVTDHTMALNELKELAAAKAITIPATITENGMDACNKLNDKTGVDFDKKYSDMMVDGHKAAVSKFEKASTNCEDADIKNWAAAMLPKLRTHLDHALTCQKESEKK